MQETLVVSRRKGDRRKVAVRRSGSDRRLAHDPRLGERRQQIVPVDLERRRRGVDRRARNLSTLSARSHHR